MGEHRSPCLRPSADAVAAYRLVQRRVDDLLRGHGRVADLAVPACPRWTIRLLVAHLTGVAQDIATSNLDGVATEAWTQAQTDRLGDRDVDDLLDMWGELTDAVTARVGQPGLESAASQLVFDTLTHEHDLRGALGAPAPREPDPAVDVALGFLTTAYADLFAQDGLPVFVLTTPATGQVCLGDPAARADGVAVDLSDFEALRAFGGRRSERQLRSLPWRGDPTGLIAALANDAIRPPDDDLIE